jgi:hypothetical protein
MVTPKDGKRISKIDMYLNCADNYIVLPAKKLQWVLEDDARSS